ncbi:hypothetical protein BaRGS_00005599, partial [Batillaria attramentaria]
MGSRSENMDLIDNGKQKQTEEIEMKLSQFGNISGSINAEGCKPQREFTVLRVLARSVCWISFESPQNSFTAWKEVSDAESKYATVRRTLQIADDCLYTSLMYASFKIGPLMQHDSLSQVIDIAVGENKASRLLSKIMRALDEIPQQVKEDKDVLQRVVTVLLGKALKACYIYSVSQGKKKQKVNLIQQTASELGSRYAVSKSNFIPNTLSHGDVKTGGKQTKQILVGTYSQSIQGNDSHDDDKHSFIIVDELDVLDRDKKSRDSEKATRTDSDRFGEHDSDEQTISPRIQGYGFDKKEREQSKKSFDIDKEALRSRERKDELESGLKLTVKPLDSRGLQLHLDIEDISNADNDTGRPNRDAPTRADLGGKRTSGGNLNHPYRNALSTMPQHSTQSKQPLPGLADGLTGDADGIRPFGTQRHAGNVQTSYHEDQQDLNTDQTEQKLPEDNLDDAAEQKLSEEHSNENAEQGPAEEIPDKNTEPERSEPEENSEEYSKPEQSVEAVSMAAKNADGGPETPRQASFHSSAESVLLSGTTDQPRENKNITPEAPSLCDICDKVTKSVPGGHAEKSVESMASPGEEGKTCDADADEKVSRLSGVPPRDDQTSGSTGHELNHLPAKEGDSVLEASNLIAQPETESEPSEEIDFAMSEDDLSADAVDKDTVDQASVEAEQTEDSSQPSPSPHTLSDFEGESSPPTTFRFSQPVQVSSPPDSENFTFLYSEPTPVQVDSDSSEIVYMSQFETVESELNVDHPEDQLHHAISGETACCQHEATGSAHGACWSELPQTADRTESYQSRMGGEEHPRKYHPGTVVCTESLHSRMGGDDNTLRMISIDQEQAHRTPDNLQPHGPHHVEDSPQILFSTARESSPSDAENLPNRIHLPPIIVHAAGALPPWATKKPRLDLRQAASYDNANLLVRRATFHHGWPEESRQDLANTALAGFYYTGRNRQVRCWWCGVIIDCLNSGQDPWEEHTRLSPSCRYLVEMKGEPFTQSK